MRVKIIWITDSKAYERNLLDIKEVNTNEGLLEFWVLGSDELHCLLEVPVKSILNLEVKNDRGK